MDNTAWTDIVTALGAVGALGTVTVGLWLGRKQLLSMDKARNVETITNRSQQWDDARLVEARLAINEIDDSDALWDSLVEKGIGQTQEWYLYMRIPHFFEHLGLATLRAKALDEDLVMELFEGAIKAYWERYATLIKKYQDHMDDPKIFEWFEKLAAEAKKIEEKRKAMTRASSPN